MNNIKRFGLIIGCSCITMLSTACYRSASESENQEEEQVSVDITTEGDEDVTIEIDPNNPGAAFNDMAKQLENVAKQMQGEEGEAVEVINFRELKELLPNRVAGMKMDDSSGETAGAMGFKISTAEAQYKDNDREIEISIADVGGAPMALMGMAAWTSLEYEKDTDKGYERTTTIEGHKAFEKYYDSQKEGEIGVLVSKRFIVSVKGYNVSMDDIQAALKRIDLDDLEKLAGN